MEFKEWAISLGLGLLGAAFLIILDKSDAEYYVLAIFALAVLFGGWSKSACITATIGTSITWD